MDEEYAARILATAINEGRSAELLQCLFEGGSCTVGPDGRLVLVKAATLAEMGREQ